MKFYDKSKMSIFWWKFNFKGSKEIIFRMGHVTIGLHMLHSVNFWLDLKIESKNIRIFQIVDSTSKTDKNIEISFFKNIKKWTCEADFQGWKKVIFITQIWGHFKVQFQTQNNLWWKNITVISWIFVNDILEGTLLLTSRFRSGQEPDRKFHFWMF